MNESCFPYFVIPPRKNNNKKRGLRKHAKFTLKSLFFCANQSLHLVTCWPEYSKTTWSETRTKHKKYGNHAKLVQCHWRPRYSKAWLAFIRITFLNKRISPERLSDEPLFAVVSPKNENDIHPKLSIRYPLMTNKSDAHQSNSINKKLWRPTIYASRRLSSRAIKSSERRPVTLLL